MAALTARCKGCGAQLFTGISTGWVEHPVLGPHVLGCARCGALATYHGADFAPAGLAGVG